MPPLCRLTVKSELCLRCLPHSGRADVHLRPAGSCLCCLLAGGVPYPLPTSVPFPVKGGHNHPMRVVLCCSPTHPHPTPPHPFLPFFAPLSPQEAALCGLFPQVPLLSGFQVASAQGGYCWGLQDGRRDRQGVDLLLGPLLPGSQGCWPGFLLQLHLLTWSEAAPLPRL